MRCLTTLDNPYHPVDQFDDWYAFDVQKGYNTLSLLARFSRTSYELTDSENESEMENAIDKVLKLDFEKKYKIIEAPNQ